MQIRLRDKNSEKCRNNFAQFSSTNESSELTFWLLILKGECGLNSTEELVFWFASLDLLDSISFARIYYYFAFKFR